MARFRSFRLPEQFISSGSLEGGCGFELSYPFKHIPDCSHSLGVDSHPQRGPPFFVILVQLFWIGSHSYYLLGKQRQISQGMDSSLLLDS